MAFPIAFLLSLFACLPALAGAAELLPPEKAFRFSARVVSDQKIEVAFRIAAGYYLYRDRFRFQSEPAVLGEPALPAGKVKEDKFFGRMETFRGELRFVIPVTRTSADTGVLSLTVVSQGCADVGVCFPPHESRAKLKLARYAPEGAAGASGASGKDALRVLAANMTQSEGGFLPPERAFQIEAGMRDASTAFVRFTPADGYYLYRDKLGFSIAAEGVEIADVKLPPAEAKDDPTYGRAEVYHTPFEAILRVERSNPAGAIGPLKVDYQGCADQGLCYPPLSRSFDLQLTGTANAKPGAGAAAATPVLPADFSSQSEDSRLATTLKDGGLWVGVATFFGLGLLLAFTPCVFPVIPILSGIIAGQDHTRLTHTRGFLLAAAYVFGMAITYAIAGVAAGLSGTMLSAALQNPWVLGTFAAIFVVLAFSMFGFYELQLPTFLQSKLAEEANRLHGGHVASVFAMGAISALIVGPCVAPPLAGALLYISQTRDVVQGGAALFSLGLGMGAPLLMIGATGGAVLPKTGPWMESVKQVFGVLMLGVAIWLISPLIPSVVHMLLWAALLICSAIFLHAVDPLPPGASGFRKLWKGFGVISLLLGVALLIGALSGGRDILQPLSGLRSAGAVPEGKTRADLSFQPVRTLAELEANLKAAAGRPVMLDFYADWCVSCKEMDRFTFSDGQVRGAMDRFVLLQADVTSASADDKALLKRFGLFGPPGYIFFDRNGQEIPGLRVVGFKAAAEFLQVLVRAERS